MEEYPMEYVYVVLDSEFSSVEDVVTTEDEAMMQCEQRWLISGRDYSYYKREKS